MIAIMIPIVNSDKMGLTNELTLRSTVLLEKLIILWASQ